MISRVGVGTLFCHRRGRIIRPLGRKRQFAHAAFRKDRAQQNSRSAGCADREQEQGQRGVARRRVGRGSREVAVENVSGLFGDRVRHVGADVEIGELWQQAADLLLLLGGCAVG